MARSFFAFICSAIAIFFISYLFVSETNPIDGIEFVGLTYGYGEADVAIFQQSFINSNSSVFRNNTGSGDDGDDMLPFLRYLSLCQERVDTESKPELVESLYDCIPVPKNAEVIHGRWGSSTWIYNSWSVQQELDEKFSQLCKFKNIYIVNNEWYFHTNSHTTQNLVVTLLSFVDEENSIAPSLFGIGKRMSVIQTPELKTLLGNVTSIPVENSTTYLYTPRKKNEYGHGIGDNVMPVFMNLCLKNMLYTPMSLVSMEDGYNSSTMAHRLIGETFNVIAQRHFSSPCVSGDVCLKPIVLAGHNLFGELGGTGQDRLRGYMHAQFSNYINNKVRAHYVDKIFLKPDDYPLRVVLVDRRGSRQVNYTEMLSYINEWYPDFDVQTVFYEDMSTMIEQWAVTANASILALVPGSGMVGNAPALQRGSGLLLMDSPHPVHQSLITAMSHHLYLEQYRPYYEIHGFRKNFDQLVKKITKHSDIGANDRSLLLFLETERRIHYEEKETFCSCV